MTALADRDALFHSHLYLCRRGARKFWRNGLERCDLEQVGAIGLLKACERFDPGLGTPFEAFAWLMVVGELMHFVRDFERPLRIPRELRRWERLFAKTHERLLSQLQREPTDAELAAELGPAAPDVCRLRALSRVSQMVPLEEYGEIHTMSLDGLPSELCIEDRLALNQALCQLRPIERTVVLGIYSWGLNQSEVARYLHVSPRQVSRLHRRALRSLQSTWSGTVRSGHFTLQQVPIASQGAVVPVETSHSGLQDERGFTLLELMIVVAIIAIIASILIPNFFHARSQAAVSACLANIRSISTALELYYTDTQTYPGSGPVTSALFGANATKYLTQVPSDPAAAMATATYTYTAPAAANASYQIVCPGIHEGSTLSHVGNGGATADSNYNITYDSAGGFGYAALGAGRGK